nr:MAG TPA: hypothetical protein [Caudoviricetes sp.]
MSHGYKVIGSVGIFYEHTKLFPKKYNLFNIIPFFSDKCIKSKLIILNIIIEISGFPIPPCDNYLIHRIKIFSVFRNGERFILPYRSERLPVDSEEDVSVVWNFPVCDKENIALFVCLWERKSNLRPRKVCILNRVVFFFIRRINNRWFRWDCGNIICSSNSVL